MKFMYCCMILVQCMGQTKPAHVGDIVFKDVSEAFYAGLLAPPHAQRDFFQAALQSANPFVREEAARKLIPFVLQDKNFANRMARVTIRSDSRPTELTLRCAVFYKLELFSEVVQLAQYTAQNAWDKALTAAAEQNTNFLFTEPITDAYRWAATELEKYCSKTESNALAGRLNVSRSSYKDAIEYFKKVIAQEPQYIVQYVFLLSDVGRAFQSANAKEGLNYFSEWAKNITLSDEVRYRIFYYMGRMERTLANYSKAADYFSQALNYTSNLEQKDTAIWYLIHSTFLDKPEKSLALITLYQSQWHDNNYFSDIFDLLSRYLTATQQWDSLLTVFLQLNASAHWDRAAKYAFILGRAIDSDLFPPTPAVFVVSDVSKDSVARAFFTYAFEKTEASFYYRASAASRIGKAVLLPELEALPTVEEKSDALNFFLDFFNYGASAYAFSYLNDRVNEFSIPELRLLAQAFADSYQWKHTIRLVTSYQKRPEYTLSRTDLMLAYPRPFIEIIEKYARETRVPVEILFGLIRTESLFDPNAVSWAGAQGLSQLMPATARDHAQTIARQGGPNYLAEGTVEVFNPEVNVHIGSSYLQMLTPRIENRMLALMSYNGGLTRVRRWRTAEPKLPVDIFIETVDLTETREYGKSVTAAAGVYAYLYYAKSMETVINETYKSN
ncbi:MAG: lytic transglycosylase domain-containing protein [Treponema sp.]|nr:lytic transglycosylase domain-containing protein [Treponema sp.]